MSNGRRLRRGNEVTADTDPIVMPGHTIVTEPDDTGDWSCSCGAAGSGAGSRSDHEQENWLAAERNFPLPRPEDDPRFTFGLTHDIARRLIAQGYPELTGVDFVELQLALFGFLYAPGSAPKEMNQA